MVARKTSWCLTLLTFVAVGLGGISSPAQAVQEPRDRLAVSSYEMTTVDRSTFRFQLDLEAGLTLQTVDGVVAVRDESGEYFSTFPQTFRVDDEWRVRGEWRQISATALEFSIVESVRDLANGEVGLNIRGRGPGYWGCVAKSLQNGAITGAIFGVPGGPATMGTGLLFGGLGGSIAGAVTCR